MNALYEYDADDDGATMTDEDKKYLREAREKDRLKQLMFLGGEDQQAKGLDHLRNDIFLYHKNVCLSGKRIQEAI